MTMTPTKRTLKAIKADPNVSRVAIVEKWQAFAQRGKGPRGVRQDAFGIIDILALDRIKGVRGIQSTGTDFSGHMNAILGEKREASIDWLTTPGTTFELWGWRKLKNGRYEPRIHVFSLDDFLHDLPEGF